jgi:hypothetical protein
MVKDNLERAFRLMVPELRIDECISCEAYTWGGPTGPRDHVRALIPGLRDYLALAVGS